VSTRVNSASGVSALAIAALLLASCSGGQDSSNGAQASPSSHSPSASRPASAPAYDEPWLDDLVPVGGGRKLHTTCWGHGSPAVINLHGLIMPYDSASWAHSLDQREAIAPHTTYCEYERTNVGTSSKEAGPIPIMESAHDLNALLDAIGIRDPVVLVAGSHGGLIGTLFAGTYPDRLAGMVLRDPELLDPRGELLERYTLAKYRTKPDAWKENAEKQSRKALDDALIRRTLDNIPKVPGLLFAASEDNYPPGTRVKPFMTLLRTMQRDLVDRFQPGRMVVLHAGHSLEGYDDRINRGILRVAGLGS
jgi:pimeloyl-ACP methyl ester carboxylesterase